MKTIRIIGSACGFGRKDRGRADGPDALRKFGLISHLRKLGLRISWGNTVNPPSDLGDAKQSAWEMHAHLCR
ncbi:MAG: hypothetical protein ABFS02_07765, partial [Pseudomonadota bacterium]